MLSLVTGRALDILEAEFKIVGGRGDRQSNLKQAIRELVLIRRRSVNFYKALSPDSPVLILMESFKP
jgi:hypothetical protein